MHKLRQESQKRRLNITILLTIFTGSLACNLYAVGGEDQDHMLTTAMTYGNSRVKDTLDDGSICVRYPI
jgi:hypothetical protein